MHTVALLPIERCRQLYEDCFSITSLLTPEAERIYYEEALGLMQSLPAAPSEDEGSVEERGMWSFTEGILRMVLGSTASETGSAHELFVRAEADIGRSLKAHPTNVDAWIALSELSWRKQDYADARRALCMAQTYAEHLDKNPTCESNFPDKPELKKTQRRRIHRELGRILKYCGGTTAERAECRLAAIDAAKCAVAMDPADPSSWYVLGHAFLAEFMSNAHTAVDLLGRCVKAFRRALQLLCEHRPEGAGCARQHSSQFFITPHPDIYYNMGVVLHFQGHFNEACCYLRHAYKQDPTHLNSAKNLVDEMIQTSVRARSIVANRGGLSTRSLAKRLPKTGITLDEVSAAKATSNTIPPTPVSILILDVLSASHTVPVSVVGVDRKLRFVLLLLYNVRYDAVCCYDVVTCKFPPSVLIDEDQNKVSNKCMFPAVQSDGDVCGNTRGSATPLWEDVMEGLTIVIPDLSTCLWNGKQVNSLQMFETPSLMVHTFSS